MRPVPGLAVLSLCLAANVWAADDELPVQALAELQRAEAKAVAEVSARFGGRAVHELGNEERAALARETEAATAKVFEERGVDRAAYLVRTMRLSAAEREAVAAATRALDEQERAQAEAALAPPQGELPAAQVDVARGKGDEDPVVVAEDESAVEVVDLANPGAGEQPAAATDEAPPRPAKAAPKRGKSRPRRR